MIITLIDYTPIPRYDGTPWVSSRVEESAAETGPWAVALAGPLIPVDTDPEHPQAREFSFESDLTAGWYRVIFVDGVGNEQTPTEPIQNVPPLSWIPSLADVGKVDMARTRDDVGNELQTFTDKTKPTDDQVLALISSSVDEVRPQIGSEIPNDLEDLAKQVVSLRTAMYIELTYFGSEVAQNRSPYPFYKTLYDELLPKLVAAVIAEESGAETIDAVTGVGTMPSFHFPHPTDWMEGKM